MSNTKNSTPMGKQNKVSPPTYRPEPILEDCANTPSQPEFSDRLQSILFRLNGARSEIAKTISLVSGEENSYVEPEYPQSHYHAVSMIQDVVNDVEALSYRLREMLR